jgi:hypothetical protein
MFCDEYKKLDLHHQYAVERVRRYAKPDEEPKLVYLTRSQLENKLGEARADEIAARLAMQDHLKTCEVCDQPTNGGEQLPNLE